MRTAELVRARAEEWLHASGARRVWTTPIGDGLTAGQHQAGTCRMGDDPATSVTDPWGRVHGHDNLWVMDASVHVTNGPVNPVLTIFALAFRSAEQLAPFVARAATIRDRARIGGARDAADLLGDRPQRREPGVELVASSLNRRTVRVIAESEKRWAGQRCEPWPNVVTASRVGSDASSRRRRPSQRSGS